jgi:hypothetical protein
VADLRIPDISVNNAQNVLIELGFVTGLQRPGIISRRKPLKYSVSGSVARTG